MLVGVTGNSGCGQTSFATELASCGAEVCSLDRVGHRLLARRRIARRAGRNLGLPGLEDLDPPEARRLVGEEVFASRRRLEVLNSLLHPMMRRWAHIAAERVRDCGGIFVLEGALIMELGLAPLFDRLVVIVDTLERCRRRAALRDGVSAGTVEARWRAQWSMQRKAAAADVVVRNSGREDLLLERARALYRSLRRM